MKDLKLYNILLFLLIISVAGGTYLLPIDLGFISLYFFRVILILILIIIIFKRSIIFNTGKFTKSLLALQVIWIIYGIITFLWSKDLMSSTRDIFYLTIGLITHIVLVTLFFRNNYDHKTFYTAWIVGFIALLIIAGIEINNAFHFKGNFASKLLTFHPNHPIKNAAVTTFDNPNNYSLYLALSVAIFIPLIKSNLRNIIWMLITLAALIIVINSSKIPMIALGIMAFVILIIELKEKRYLVMRGIKVLSFALLLVLTLFISNRYLEKEIGVAPAEVYHGPKVEQPQLPESSVSIRKNLILNGWQFFKESYGMGIGAGMYSHYIEKGMAKYDVSTVRNPHNWVVQIGSQYGSIILLLLLLWALWTFIHFVNSFSFFRHDQNTYPVLLFGLLMIITYFIVSNSSSSFIQLPINWVSLSLIAIAADRILQLKNEPTKQ